MMGEPHLLDESRFLIKIGGLQKLFNKYTMLLRLPDDIKREVPDKSR